MKSWVEEHLLTAKKDKLSAKRINKKWFLARGFSHEYNSLIAINPDLTLACKIVLGWTSNCKTCGNIVVLPRVYCCTSCQMLDPDNKAKVEKTMLERYGVTTASHSKEIRAKAKATMVERYGVEFSWQSDELRAKRDATVKERYGVDHISQSQESQQRKIAKHKEKYGVENPMQRKEVQEKVRRTNLEKYGHKSAIHSPVIKEKIRQNHLKQYGVEWPMQRPEVMEKSKQTNLEKNGFAYSSQSHYTPELLEGIQNGLKDVTGPNDPLFSCVSLSTAYKLLNQHRSDLVKKLSMQEDEIIDFIKESTTHEVITNSRKYLDGLELDCYIPDLNLAFEYNGSYWHSDKFKPKTYHQDKSLLAKNKGIRLVHLYEHNGFEHNKELIELALNGQGYQIEERDGMVYSSLDCGYIDLPNFSHIDPPVETFPGLWNAGYEVFIQT